MEELNFKSLTPQQKEVINSILKVIEEGKKYNDSIKEIINSLSHRLEEKEAIEAK